MEETNKSFYKNAPVPGKADEPVKKEGAPYPYFLKSKTGLMHLMVLNKWEYVSIRIGSDRGTVAYHYDKVALPVDRPEDFKNDENFEPSDVGQFKETASKLIGFNQALKERIDRLK